MIVHCRQESPLRPPDWRFQRIAFYEKESRDTERSRIDRITAGGNILHKKLKSCLSERNEVKKQHAIDKFYDMYPDFGYAYSLYTEDNNITTRWEIEARILAGENFESIADKSNFSPSCLEVYEKLFFNVLDRLNKRTWVTNSVVGRALQVGLTERDFNILWKIYGYMAGPHMLDLLISKIGMERKIAKTPEQAQAMLSDSIPNMAMIKSAFAMNVGSINNFTAVQIIQVEQAYRQMLREANSEASKTTFLQAISNIMTGLPWSVGIGNIENPVLSSLSTVDRLAAEPRANEMIEVACGNDVTNELEQLRLPEPEAKNVN